VTPQRSGPGPANQDSGVYRRRMATAAGMAALFAILGLSVWWMISAWTRIDARMSGHGWTALILGVVFCIFIGCGLMALLFFSSRRGYDEPPKFDRSDRSSKSDS
jgi:hypothetical protein